MDRRELFVTSRAKDLIKRGGRNIHPYDLEAAVGDVAGIRKGCVAVFGTADSTTGSERVIVVAETNRADAASRDALRDRIMALAAIHLNGAPDEVLLVPPRRSCPRETTGPPPCAYAIACATSCVERVGNRISRADSTMLAPID